MGTSLREVIYDIGGGIKRRMRSLRQYRLEDRLVAVLLHRIWMSALILIL